ncbi:hypothetical protein ONZ45_g3133 [Pleurotus djamor]|nr:hypothetical protein ONZ45_g3133 [Pleurotus djamor]
MAGDPRNITLPSIREWLGGKYNYGLSSGRRDANFGLSLTTSTSPQAPSAPRYPPLPSIKQHLRSRRSVSPVHQPQVSPSSSFAPLACSQSTYMGRRRSQTDSQLRLSGNFVARDDPRSVLPRSSIYDNRGARIVDRPLSFHPQSVVPGPNHHVRPDTEGDFGLIPPIDVLPDTNSLASQGARFRRLNGGEPHWRVPMTDSHFSRPTLRHDGNSPGVLYAAGEHRVITFPVSPHSTKSSLGRSDDQHQHLEVGGSSTGGSDPNRRHVCPICPRRFNRPSSLRIHINTHTGETPFKCTWPDCGREFNVNSNMRRHLRNHANPDGRAGPTSRMPAESVRVVRTARSTDAIDPDSLAPPISTLCLQDTDTSTTPSLRGSDCEDDDYDMSAPDDGEEEDELSDDECRSPANGAKSIAHSPPSSVYSPALSTSSSFTASTRSIRELSFSPPPPPSPPRKRSLLASPHCRFEDSE